MTEMGQIKKGKAILNSVRISRNRDGQERDAAAYERDDDLHWRFITGRGA